MFPLFPLGQIVATPGALAALERAKQPPTSFLARHASGDWGELEPADVTEPAAGTSNPPAARPTAPYSRVAMPQTKISAKDLAISLTEKRPPARSDKYV